MQLTMKKRQDIENPAVTIEYRELTENVKRVCDFVRGIDKTILCKKEGQSLGDYLTNVIFAGNKGSKIAPDPKDVEGFEAFMEKYRRGLSVEKAAVEM